MEIITGDILDITSGIICQQVNCQGAYGAGLSGIISRKYPKVERAYRELCASKTPDELFGLCQPVRVSNELIIVNIFAEREYANAYETGVVSTDMDTLVDCLRRVCLKYVENSAEPFPCVYIPHRIGCGLAGGNWDVVSGRVNEMGLPLVAVRLPNKN